MSKRHRRKAIVHFSKRSPILSDRIYRVPWCVLFKENYAKIFHTG